VTLELKKAFLCALFLPAIAFSATGEWKWQNPRPQGYSLRSIHFPSVDTGFIGGEAGAFLSTHDGGQNWKSSNLTGGGWIYSVGFRDSRTGLVLQGTDFSYPRKKSSLLLTQDGGETWARILTATGNDDSPIQWVGHETVFLGTDSLLKVSRNGGHDWTDCGLAGIQVISYSFLTPDRGYVLARSESGFKIFETTDGCTQFSYIPIPDSLIYSTIRLRDPGSLFLGGTDGQTLKLLHTEDDGRTWSDAAVAEPRPWAVKSLHFADNLTGFVFALDGTLLKSKDGGVTWNTIYIAPSQGSSIQFDFVNDRIAYWAGAYGLMEKSLDGGDSWKEISHGAFDSAAYEGTYSGLYDVDFADAKAGIAVGGKGTDRHHGIMLRTTNAGGIWDTVPLPSLPTLLSVRFRDASFGLAVGDSGLVLKSSDGGATWERLGRASDVAQLYYVRFGLGNNIFAYGRGQGPLLRSTDGGRSWIKILSDPKVVFNSLDIRPTRIGMAAGFRTTTEARRACIFRTLDGGDTWQELPLLKHGTDTLQEQLRAVNVVSPGLAFAVDANWNLYRSKDDGSTWDSVSALDRFSPDAMFFRNADSGFVLNGLGIGFTQDGGHTWTRQLSMDARPSIRAMTFAPDGNGYAVGEMAAIWSYQRGPTAIRTFAGPLPGPRLSVDGKGIHYRVDSRDPVIVELAQVNGALAARLSEGVQDAGDHTIPLPARSGNGPWVLDGNGPWVVDVSIGRSHSRCLISSRPK
jgi:photosystem II stability/assembly factor-like uncharacterized protein